MTRYNYRQSAFERVIGQRPHIAFDVRLRASLLALGLAFCIVALAGAAEHRRLASLDATLHTLQDRLAVADATDAVAARTRRAVAHDRRVRFAVLAARRDGALDANTIAAIGNLLPAQTWLTGIRDDRSGRWSLAGRSTHIDRIGATLAAVGLLAPADSPHLVSIHTAGRRAQLLDFTIAWGSAP